MTNLLLPLLATMATIYAVGFVFFLGFASGMDHEARRGPTWEGALLVALVWPVVAFWLCDGERIVTRPDWMR